MSASIIGCLNFDASKNEFSDSWIIGFIYLFLIEQNAPELIKSKYPISLLQYINKSVNLFDISVSNSLNFDLFKFANFCLANCLD